MRAYDALAFDAEVDGYTFLTKFDFIIGVANRFHDQSK